MNKNKFKCAFCTEEMIPEYTTPLNKNSCFHLLNCKNCNSTVRLLDKDNAVSLYSAIKYCKPYKVYYFDNNTKVFGGEKVSLNELVISFTGLKDWFSLSDKEIHDKIKSFSILK